MFVKIFTAGHEVPSDETILSFKRIVWRFLQDNADNGPYESVSDLFMLLLCVAPFYMNVWFLTSAADKLIGVHCTHGLNRTGYLICRCARSQFDPSTAEHVTRF